MVTAFQSTSFPKHNREITNDLEWLVSVEYSKRDFCVQALNGIRKEGKMAQW